MAGGNKLPIDNSAAPAAAPASADPPSVSAPAEVPRASLKVTCVPEYTEVAATQAEEILAVVGLEADAAATGTQQQRPGVDVICVIDRSGSMAGEKLHLTQETLRFMVNQLSASDTLTIITYDTNVAQPLARTAMTPQGKRDATERIGTIKAGDATNLSGGLFRGLDAVASRDVPNKVCSVLLMTDGQANVGLRTTAEILPRLREQLNRPGVEGACNIYTFGFGSDHDDAMLRSIAEAGRGSYYFIRDAAAIPLAFADCLGGLQSVVAQGITVAVKAHGDVSFVNVFAGVNKVTGTVPGTAVTVDVYDIFAEEQRDFVLNVRVPAGVEPRASETLATVTVTYLDLVYGGRRTITADLIVARPATVPANRVRQERVEVQRHRVNLVRALEDARRLAEQGQFAQAQTTVRTAANSMRASPYYQSNTVMQAMVLETIDTEGALSSRDEYQQHGRMQISARSMAHTNQRDTNSEYSVYETNAKRSAKSAASWFFSPRKK